MDGGRERARERWGGGAQERERVWSLLARWLRRLRRSRECKRRARQAAARARRVCGVAGCVRAHCSSDSARFRRRPARAARAHHGIGPAHHVLPRPRHRRQHPDSRWLPVPGPPVQAPGRRSRRNRQAPVGPTCRPPPTPPHDASSGPRRVHPSHISRKRLAAAACGDWSLAGPRTLRSR